MGQKRNREKTNSKRFAWENFLPIYLVIAGLVGVIASLSLALEKIALLEDPTRTPLCNINPVLSCGSVMDSAQASLFGVPHSLLGIVAFSALLTLGVVLFSGAKFKPWIWKIAITVAFFGMLSVQYLVYESLYKINALCPWCMVIWIATMPLFFGIVSYVARTKSLNIGNLRLKRALFFIEKHNVTLLVIWFIVVIYLIVIQFWSYWSTLL